MTEVCTINRDEHGSAHLAGVLTFESTPDLYRESEKLFEGAAHVSSIDLSAVTEVDSSGLALLLEWQATRKTTDGSLKITNAPSNLVSLARLCNAVELLNLTGRNGTP